MLKYTRKVKKMQFFKNYKRELLSGNLQVVLEVPTSGWYAVIKAGGAP